MASNSESSCIGKDSSGETRSVKVLILGEAGIGKTTLIKTFLETTGVPVPDLYVNENYLFVMFPSRMNCKGEVVDVGFVDLISSANSLERRKCYPDNVNAILLCFSVSNYGTLQSIYNHWIQEVRAHFGKLKPVLLVGLRSDLRLARPNTLDSVLRCEETRVVSKAEGELIHQNYNFHGDYMECNTFSTDSVIRVMQKTVLAAMED